MRAAILTAAFTAVSAPAVSAPAVSAPAVSVADAGLATRLDPVLARWVEAEKVVGVVALVARDGEVVYRRALGSADREAGRPVRHDTIFRLASMTKLITTTAALALVEQGVLSPDDPVTRWLPEFTPALPDGRRPTITLRHLMTHTSGLSYVFMEDEDNVYRREGIPQGLEAGGGSLRDVLRRIASVPLFFEPGTQWRYSLSTDVLGGVVEAAAGEPLPAAVERLVTGPLGMRDTTFGVRDAERLAAPYVDGPEQALRMNPHEQVVPVGSHAVISPNRTLDPDAWPSGGGGMTGTAGDYLALLEALRTGGGAVLRPGSAQSLALHTVGSLRAITEGPGWGYSLGAAVLLDPAAAATPQSVGTWQWGGALGTHWFVDPARRLSVVVMTNTAVAGVIGDFPAAVRDAIYGAVAGAE